MSAMFTTAEKLAEVELLIEREKQASQWNRHRIAVLASIAVDLRARLDGVPTAILVDLERRVVSAVRSKTALGYDAHAIRGVGEGLVVRWPTVKQALERFGDEQDRPLVDPGTLEAAARVAENWPDEVEGRGIADRIRALGGA